MLRRLCDFCEKKEPDYTIKCRRTNHRCLFDRDWKSVDICEECYCKLFPKEINITPEEVERLRKIGKTIKENKGE